MVRPCARMAVAVVTGGIVFAGAAVAQKVISAKSGLVLFVQGRASIDGNSPGAGALPLKSGNSYRQLQDGQRLSTQRGRAEILLNPGMVLRLGDLSRMHMDDIKITDACVALESGAAVVTVNFIAKNDRIRLIAGGSEIVLKKAGVYRFDLARQGAALGRLRVFNGWAEVKRAGSVSLVNVKRGQAVALDALEVTPFDIKEADSLQLWASMRNRAITPRTFGMRPQPPRMDVPNSPPPRQSAPPPTATPDGTTTTRRMPKPPKFPSEEDADSP